MSTTATSTTTATYWVHVYRDHGPDLLVGPYPTREDAEHAEQDAPLVDHLLSPSGGGGVDTGVSGIRDGFMPGLPYVDQHWIDLTDPHHTGLPEDTGDGARLALHALFLADQAENDAVRTHITTSLNDRWPGATDRIHAAVDGLRMSPDDMVAWALEPSSDAVLVLAGA